MQYPPATIIHSSNTLEVMLGATSTNYPDRLQTFQGYWSDCELTARQLAAIGHVYDRPPLEALEEGTRCTSCSLFVPRDTSVRILQGRLSGLSSMTGTNSIREAGFFFHHPGCIRLQLRIPLDLQAGYSAIYRMGDVREFFERRSKAASSAHRPAVRRVQKSLLFSLPTEIRLQIYAMVLPAMDSVTPIVPLNGESGRIVTAMGAEKTGPRDMTKTNLLSTCWAVYEEALDLLFSNVTYRFQTSKRLYLFLRHIGHHGRQLLTSVDIMCGGREDAITFAVLASCPRLRKITIRLGRKRLLPSRASLHMIEGIACLLEISGVEDVCFGSCEKSPCFDEQSPDAAGLRRELTRPKNEPGSIHWADGFPTVGFDAFPQQQAMYPDRR